MVRVLLLQNKFFQNEWKTRSFFLLFPNDTSAQCFGGNLSVHSLKLMNVQCTGAYGSPRPRMVAAFSTSIAGTLVAPVAGNVNLLSIKNNFLHLIHQAELSVNGKTVEDSQPFVNIAKHFQTLSEMSVGDFKTIGYSLGITDVDDWKSKIYNGSTSATVSTKSGNDMTNNRPFTSDTIVGGLADNITSTANQFDRIVNTT